MVQFVSQIGRLRSSDATSVKASSMTRLFLRRSVMVDSTPIGFS